MKILFCGDVVGKAGRKALKKYLPEIQNKYNPDVVIANVENAAHGFGLTPKIFDEFKNMGIHVLTMGNHTFDKSEINPLLQNEETLIRPLNYPVNTIGKGFCIFQLQNGQKLGVVQLLGRVFMRPYDDPFMAIDNFLSEYKLKKDFDALIVDFHAEATAEKKALASFLDGKVSGVFGTHTHIPTSDAFILENGTAFQTDVGMCGDYNSVIGMRVQEALARFLGQPAKHFVPAEKNSTFCGVLITTDDQNGLSTNITSIQLGDHLKNTF